MKTLAEFKCYISNVVYAVTDAGLMACEDMDRNIVVNSEQYNRVINEIRRDGYNIVKQRYNL